MNSRRCLRIAERLQLPFEQQIGVAIDARRMVGDAAYAADVLMVCDSRPESSLAVLARFFRLAAAEQLDAGEPQSPPAATGWDTASTGFGPTSSQPPNSAFDEARQAARAARRAADWTTPGRWLGSDS